MLKTKAIQPTRHCLKQNKNNVVNYKFLCTKFAVCCSLIHRTRPLQIQAPQGFSPGSTSSVSLRLPPSPRGKALVRAGSRIKSLPRARGRKRGMPAGGLLPFGGFDRTRLCFQQVHPLWREKSPGRTVAFAVLSGGAFLLSRRCSSCWAALLAVLRRRLRHDGARISERRPR
jgi:hypothetical protein